jgi:hypothetical protein
MGTFDPAPNLSHDRQGTTSEIANCGSIKGARPGDARFFFQVLCNLCMLGGNISRLLRRAAQLM